MSLHKANNFLLDPQSNLLCHVIHKPGVIYQPQPEPPQPHALEAAWEGGGAPSQAQHLVATWLWASHLLSQLDSHLSRRVIMPLSCTAGDGTATVEGPSMLAPQQPLIPAATVLGGGSLTRPPPTSCVTRTSALPSLSFLHGRRRK